MRFKNFSLMHKSREKSFVVMSIENPIKLCYNIIEERKGRYGPMKR
jgi:hypothetical protein